MLERGVRTTLRLAVLSVWCFILAQGLRAQISPGPLARAHQSLNGPANCTKCHSVSTRSPEFRCLDCHTEIAAEIQQHRGLHSTYPQSGPPGAACVKCHSDHNGENFNMLHWNPTPQGFDHSVTGYVLDGKHSSVGCRACHTAQHISAAARGLPATKDLGHTWMGLSTDCATCHQDPHKGRFGTTCARCHSTADWKQAKIVAASFDHSKTQFPLTGMHLKTACEKCHRAGSDGQPVYSGMKFGFCADCHADPHKGSFTQPCESCHTTATWKKSTFESKFDHSKTSYPLLGKHSEVPCLTCHVDGNFKKPMAHAQCADCHKPDPHGGQFAHRPDGGRCESCHTVQGWHPTTFSVADHGKTAFPLIVPHAGVNCDSCHIPAGKDTVYKVKFARCIDCHKDPHEGQFAGEPWRNRCEQCHAGATFKLSNMTLARHQKTRFPLTGGHIAVACNECHKPMAGSSSAVFHFAHLACTTCHDDVHHGEFAARMATKDANGSPLGCEACHTTKEWKDLSRFDHATTRFVLEGSHRAARCADCHKPPGMEMTMLHVDFAAAPMQCAGCHENPHADQFHEKANDCAACHNTNKWRPSLFDHEKTAFSLKGGHQNVACAACHVNKRMVGGLEVLFYKPTPTACAACHGEAVPKAPPEVSFRRPGAARCPDDGFVIWTSSGGKAISVISGAYGKNAPEKLYASSKGSRYSHT